MVKVDSASKTQRRLAAILSADVEGYARLMNADEGATLNLLSAHRDITDRLIAGQGGRIANTAGDSILAEFPSAVDALQCALDILERIGAVNREIPEAHRVIFRIGLHVGEVMVRDGDMFGDGVNIAARLQGLARPGSVCLSEAAHQFVHRALPLSFEDLGSQKIKNIDSAIRAYLAWPADAPPSPVLPPVHRRAMAHLARRFHDLCSGAAMTVTAREDLIPVEFAVLASVHDAPGTDLRRLAERIGVETAKAQRYLKRLEDRGMIQRQPVRGTKRPATYEVTSQGTTLLLSLRPEVLDAMERVTASLSNDERETLRGLLVRVIKANEAKDHVDTNPSAHRDS
jgi:class 3 adenylate cyclase/DNA-binding MarR family transcriptional regulator